jgi:hypothetical protein
MGPYVSAFFAARVYYTFQECVFGMYVAEAYLGYGRQGTGRGRHLAWHNLIDLVRLGINILELILFS